MMKETSRVPRVETFLAPPKEHEGESFEGLPVFAMPGLHAHVQALATTHFRPSARLLDLGCGAGALASRLSSAGFQVTGCDAHPEVFHKHGHIPFVAADLNQDFAERFDAPFEAIVAVEIIEHLENPWHFMRQCRDLLEPRGKFLLTTPNIDTPRSVLNFIRTGTFKGFSNYDYRKDGHITHLSQWQIDKCTESAGIRLDAVDTFGPPWGKGLRHLGGKILWLLARNNPSRIGTIVVAVGSREDAG